MHTCRISSCLLRLLFVCVVKSNHWGRHALQVVAGASMVIFFSFVIDLCEVFESAFLLSGCRASWSCSCGKFCETNAWVLLRFTCSPMISTARLSLQQCRLSLFNIQYLWTSVLQVSKQALEVINTTLNYFPGEQAALLCWRTDVAREQSWQLRI